MFQHLILIQPLGLMYGSAGGFLSPDNLVGRSGEKFPPEAATLAGLICSAKKSNSSEAEQNKLKDNLRVAGPFWAEVENPEEIYVPIPWTKIIASDNWDEWYLEKQEENWIWKRKQGENGTDIEPEFRWFPISNWDDPAETIYKNKDARKSPWQFTPILHPKLEQNQRVSQAKDSLFLENAVQMREDKYLVYLSTEKLESGWYKFGGENHLVEIHSQKIDPNHLLYELLNEEIQSCFALITPGVWGSNRFSHQTPENNQGQQFPKTVQLLTDKPVPYRYSAGGRLGRGRYAVPAGSVYVLKKPLNQIWWNWQPELFPKEGFSLQNLGCGLALPLKIQGSPDDQSH
jgi:CRISPR-associated protein Cmr3